MSQAPLAEPSLSSQDEGFPQSGPILHLYRHFSKLTDGSQKLDMNLAPEEAKKAVAAFLEGVEDGDEIFMFGSGPDTRHRDSYNLFAEVLSKEMEETGRDVHISYPKNSAFSRQSLREVSMSPSDNNRQRVHEWFRREGAIETIGESVYEAQSRISRLVGGLFGAISRSAKDSRQGKIHIVAFSSGLTLGSTIRKKIASDMSYSLGPGEKLVIVKDPSGYRLRLPNGDTLKTDSQFCTTETLDSSALRSEADKHIHNVTERLFPNRQVDITPLTQGVMSAVYRITDPRNGAALVVKFQRDSAESRKEAFALTNWQKTGANCPHILATSGIADDISWLAMDYLPPLVYEPLLPSKEEAASKLGKQLALIHRVKAEGYGPLNARNQGSYETIEEALAAKIKEATFYLKNHGVLTADDITTIGEIARPLLKRLASQPEITPSLLHGDPGLHNCIIGNDSKLYLIDPNPESGDPLQDVAHAMNRMEPRLRDPFLNSYLGGRQLTELTKSEKHKIEIYRIYYYMISMYHNKLLAQHERAEKIKDDLFSYLDTLRE